jgi:hypothetical protein
MVKRPVQTGFNRSFTGPQIPKIVKTEDRTSVFGLLRSWEFAVLIGLGPVQSRSFSGYKTGLPNTSNNASPTFRQTINTTTSIQLTMMAAAAADDDEGTCCRSHQRQRNDDKGKGGVREGFYFFFI